MMTGVRIVTGEFTVYTRYPGRMRDLLSKAADVRASFYSESPKSQIQSYLRSEKESVEDEKNIQKYWANSQLDRLSSDNYRSSDARNIFSAHPPFNFIVKYGAQEGSMTTIARNKGTSNERNYDMIDRLMSLDYNDRLVQHNTKQMDIVLQSIHLTSMATAYAPGGSPLVESYQFIARDMYMSEGAMKNPPNGQIIVDGEDQVAQNSRTEASGPPTEEQLRERREQASSSTDYAP